MAKRKYNACPFDDSPPKKSKTKSKRTAAVLGDPPLQKLATLTAVTRSMTRKAAIKAVIDTTELLEQIILNLPMTDMLQSRRVAQRWRAIVDSNPQIQTKLFLKPIAGTPSLWLVNDAIKSVYKARLDHVSNEHQFLVKPARPNPLLFTRAPRAQQRLALVHRILWSDRVKFLRRPDFGKALGSSVVHGMFLSQPPATCVRAEFNFDIARGARAEQPRRLKYNFNIANESGVTLGDVLWGFREAVGERTADFPSGAYMIKKAMTTIETIGLVVFPTDADFHTVEG